MTTILHKSQILLGSKMEEARSELAQAFNKAAKEAAEQVEDSFEVAVPEAYKSLADWLFLTAEQQGFFLDDRDGVHSTSSGTYHWVFRFEPNTGAE